MRLSTAVFVMATTAMTMLFPRIGLTAEHMVVLHHMELEKIEGEMRVGDTVTFDNQSDMAHNLYVTYADGTVDNLDTQTPGMKRSVKLRLAGPATVRCWIHPIIRSELVILDQTESEEP